LYCANEESDDVIGGFTKTVQHSIKNISRNNWSSVHQTWHQKRTSQKKQNDTYVVAMATLLAPVSFREKTVILICNLLNGDRGCSSEYT